MNREQLLEEELEKVRRERDEAREWARRWYEEIAQSIHPDYGAYPEEQRLAEDFKALPWAKDETAP